MFGRRSRRLHGALIAHTGLAVAALGVAISSGLVQQAEATLTPGQKVMLAGYQLHYLGTEEHSEPERTVLTTRLTVDDTGGSELRMSPSISVYSGTTDPIGFPAISRGMWQDLYVTLLAVQQPQGQATFRLYLNPGVMWLWVGGALVVAGGSIAGWPTRRQSSQDSRESALAGVGQ